MRALKNPTAASSVSLLSPNVLHAGYKMRNYCLTYIGCTHPCACRSRDSFVISEISTWPGDRHRRCNRHTKVGVSYRRNTNCPVQGPRWPRSCPFPLRRAHSTYTCSVSAPTYELCKLTDLTFRLSTSPGQTRAICCVVADV